MLLSYSAGRNVGSTGAPGESSASCNGCHSGGNFAPRIEVALREANGTVVSQYEPGKTYNVEFRVVHTNGNPSRYGFQAVALLDEGNTNAGQFSQLGERVRSFNQSGRQYIVQSQPNTTGIFQASWTAPQNTTSTVSFYVAGLAANGNNSTSGDSPVRDRISIPLLITSVDETVDSASLAQISPNPVLDYAQISNITSGTLSIFNTSGTLVFKSDFEENSPLNLSTLAQGVYFARIFDGRHQKTIRFMKL